MTYYVSSGTLNSTNSTLKNRVLVQVSLSFESTGSMVYPGLKPKGRKAVVRLGEQHFRLSDINLLDA